LPLRKTKQTYPLETCYEHNMLPLLHAVCLKVLVFFFFRYRERESFLVQFSFRKHAVRDAGLYLTYLPSLFI